jgi:hypothetical protein
LGLSPRHLHARHLLLLGRLHVGHALHFLSFLITGIWTALVRLLLFGGLRQDMTAFPGQTVDTEGVRRGVPRRFRRGWTGRVIGCQRRWRIRRATCQQARSNKRYEISIHGLSFSIYTCLVSLAIQLQRSENQTAFNVKRWGALLADPELARLP